MKILFIIIALTISSCNQGSHPSFDYTRSSNPWIDAFKDRVFFSAIKEAYKSDTLIFKLIEKKDALNPYDGLSIEGIQEADKLGIDLIKKMPLPSMCENCSSGDNYYMATALHYYKSRDLDSVAKRYFKIHLKKDKNDGLSDK